MNIITRPKKYFSVIFLKFDTNCQDFFVKTMRESFGQFIRNLRSSKGYTLTQLGGLLGIDSGALSKIETDKRTFDSSRLSKLCDIFDLDLKKISDEYYSDLVANLIYDKQCSDNVLALAEAKVKYRKSKNSKQSNLNFDQ